MLSLTELTEAYAKEISTWKYEDEYSIYNYPDWEIISNQNWGITSRVTRKKEFQAVMIELYGETQLCGYFRFCENSRTVLLGLGLKPEFCGKGYGKQLIGLVIQEYQKRFTGKVLELEVRTFNKRAIKCYLKAGFSKVDTYRKKTPIGTDTFLLMRYDK